MLSLVVSLALGTGAAALMDVEHRLPGRQPITASLDPLRLAGRSVLSAGRAPAVVDAGPVFTLSALDGRLDDRFGTALAISGNTLVVGARWANIGEDYDRGAAYVFEKQGDGWVYQAKLVASDGWWLSGFGSSLALEGDTLVVGAQGHVAGGIQRGAAYVFTREAGVWRESAKLSPGEFGGGPSSFGASVGICENVVFVGASESRTGGDTARASVSVFVRSEAGWLRQAWLVGGDTVHNDRFGHSLACSGNTLLVGSPRADVDGVLDRGAAYLFRRSGELWGQEAKLVGTEGDPLDLFGWSVALQADVAVVGARGDTDGGSASAGAAYVFRHVDGAWHQQTRLGAPEGEAGDQFGESVALDGSTILVGARQEDAPDVIDEGAAHVFCWTGSAWAWRGNLSPPIGSGSVRLGTAVALRGDIAIAGAPEQEIDQTRARGVAYVFDGMQPMFESGFEAEATETAETGSGSPAPG